MPRRGLAVFFVAVWLQPSVSGMGDSLPESRTCSGVQALHEQGMSQLKAAASVQEFKEAAQTLQSVVDSPLGLQYSVHVPWSNTVGLAWNRAGEYAKAWDAWVFARTLYPYGFWSSYLVQSQNLDIAQSNCRDLGESCDTHDLEEAQGVPELEKGLQACSKLFEGHTETWYQPPHQAFTFNLASSRAQNKRKGKKKRSAERNTSPLHFLSQAVEKSPNCVLCLNDLAFTLMQVNQFSKAQKLLDRALALIPNQVRLATDLSWILTLAFGAGQPCSQGAPDTAR
jgi:tetratricopeptide (TPR) repeat protein